MLKIKTVEQAKAIRTPREITNEGKKFPNHGKPAESLDLAEERAMRIAFVNLYPNAKTVLLEQ